MIEAVTEVKKWRTGDEFRYGGRWLEIRGFQVFADRPTVEVRAYDPVDNRVRKFVAETGHLRRHRTVERDKENG